MRARAVAAASIGLLGTGLLVACSVLTPLPEVTRLDGRLQAFPIADLPLDRPVTIHWDDHQIPFVVAQTDGDGAFALGLVDAHLRLGQMGAGLSAGLSMLALAIFDYPFGINAIIGVIGSIGVSINAALIVLSGLQQDAKASAGDRAAMVDMVAGGVALSLTLAFAFSHQMFALTLPRQVRKAGRDTTINQT